MKLLELVNGTLLGDGSVKADKNKYFYYSLNAKDKDFLKKVQRLFTKFDIPTYIVVNNPITKVFALGFYINARHNTELLTLRKMVHARKWKNTKNYS